MTREQATKLVQAYNLREKIQQTKEKLARRTKDGCIATEIAIVDFGGVDYEFAVKPADVLELYEKQQKECDRIIAALGGEI